MGRIRMFVERMLPIAILLVAAIAVPTMIFAPSGLDRLGQLRAERERVDRQIARLSQRIRELKVEAQRIKDDPTRVEQAARDELGLVRATEVVFQFDP